MSPFIPAHRPCHPCINASPKSILIQTSVNTHSHISCRHVLRPQSLPLMKGAAKSQIWMWHLPHDYIDALSCVHPLQVTQHWWHPSHVSSCYPVIGLIYQRCIYRCPRAALDDVDWRQQLSAEAAEESVMRTGGMDPHASIPCYRGVTGGLLVARTVMWVRFSDSCVPVSLSTS